MYKQGSIEDELYRSMETALVKNQTEETHGFTRTAKAVDLLSTAAAIFEQAGMVDEAADVTAIIEALAKDLHE